VFVRGLSSQSYGNAAGIGMADVVTDRLVNSIDLNATYINTLTSSTPGCAKMPMHFATDKECIERISTTCGKFDQASLRIGRIRNTMELTPIVLSENLRGEIEANPLLEIAGPAYELEYDASGNLLPIRVPAGEPREASQHVSR